MSTFLISLFTLSLLLGSCSMKREPMTMPAVVDLTGWSIVFKTSGGFGGSGKGSITVTSDGKFQCSSLDRGQTVSGASGKLNARQLQPVKDAVAQLKTQGWDQPGLNISAADAFGYRVEFRSGDKEPVAVAKWYDNAADQLPEDLKRLDTVIEQTIKNVC